MCSTQERLVENIHMVFKLLGVARKPHYHVFENFQNMQFQIDSKTKRLKSLVAMHNDSDYNGEIMDFLVQAIERGV